MRGLLLTAVVFLPLSLAVPGIGVELEQGTGIPDLSGWCMLDWLTPCTSGLSWLDADGLTLTTAQVPPRSAYELELKLIPYDSLLIFLESPEGVGHVLLYLDGERVGRFPLQRGAWWIKLSHLPPQGVFRLELDRYCRDLTIRGVYFPCRTAFPMADCTQAFRNGLVAGIISTAVVFWLVYLITR